MVNIEGKCKVLKNYTWVTVFIDIRTGVARNFRTHRLLLCINPNCVLVKNNTHCFQNYEFYL